MHLARFLNMFLKRWFYPSRCKFKKLYNRKPKNENPIKVKILNKKLHYKLLFHPDLIFW